MLGLKNRGNGTWNGIYEQENRSRTERLTLEVNRPSRWPDDEGGLEIEGVHWGLVDGGGWVRVERWVRRREDLLLCSA